MPALPTRILLLEDDPDDVLLFREFLAQISEFQCEIDVCERLSQAIAYLTEGNPDVVLSDLSLPDAQGLDAVRQLHDAATEVPIVVLTGLDDESLAVQSLQEGAQDYLVKGRIDSYSLRRAIHHAIERQQVQLRALNLALIDDLTGLNNRKSFLSLGEQHLSLAYRTGAPFSLAFFDLDGLKDINDTFGHQEGDRALVEASNILRDSLRQSDVLGRLGGDEFAALITDATSNSAEVVQRRIREKLWALNSMPARRYDLSFSIGILTPDPAEPIELEILLDQADALMYQEKRRKRAARALHSAR